MDNSVRLVSLFDALGPVMVGPSSSHTAGVLRIGRMGRNFLGGDPEKVELHFYGNALARTYKGHLSDSAIFAGLLGYAENSPEVRDVLEEVRKRGISISYHPDYSSDRNPNTVDMRLERNGKRIQVVGITVGGGEILMTELEGFPISLRGSEDGFIFIAEREFSQEEIERILGTKPVSMERIQREGYILHVCVQDTPLEAEKVASLEEEKGIVRVFSLQAVLDYKMRNPKPFFASVEEMLRLAKENNLSVSQLAVNYEVSRSGLSESEIRKRIERIWKTMNESVEKGLTGKNDMVGGLVPEDSGKKLMEAVTKGKTAGGAVLGKAIARAIAAMETNACVGCVVAAPTAGSCGVIPGVLITAAENAGATEDEAVDALLVAAVMGTLIAMKASLSGSIGGCQAEIGVASAMGASALVQLLGGDAKQVAHGMALALKNILGLICDPVAGPVEIPCIKRNGIGVANAFAAADMALAGLESIIPPDEVIDALVNTQNLLPTELKGTMKGGLCSTPTANRLKNEWMQKIASQSGI
ncbi:MAG: L-serine ammonia-lyase, iron-sulfur-dependent, subunit alpha [Aminobacteriaceae bacterium]